MIKKIRRKLVVIISIVSVFIVGMIFVWLFLKRGYGAEGMIRFFPNKFFAGEKSIVIDMKTGRKKDIWTEEPINICSLSTDGTKTIEIISESSAIDGKMYHYDKIKEYNWKTKEAKMLLENTEELYWTEPHELKMISYFGADAIGFICNKDGEDQIGIYDISEHKTSILADVPAHDNVTWADDGKSFYMVYNIGETKGCLIKYVIKRTETDYQLISKEFIVDGVMSFTVSHNQKYICYSHSMIPGMLHIYDMETEEERIILELNEDEMEDMGYYDFGISPDDRYIWYTKGLYFSPVESDLRFLLYQTKLYIYSLEEEKSRFIHKQLLIENIIWFPDSFEFR